MSNVLSSAYSTFSPFPYISQLRQPRAIVTVNDISVYWTDIEIQTTTFYVADNYSVTLPLYKQNPKLDLNYWSSTVDMTVKIYVGFPLNPNSYSAADLELFMVGDVDLMDLDPLKATITLSGRDLTSRLIDTKTSEKYATYTASQVATLLAQKHGLNPVVTETTGSVGVIYNNLQVLLTKEVTEWDLITFLAQQSGFVVFVNGQDLHFEPYPVEDAKTAFTLQYQPPLEDGMTPQFNGTDLKFRRSLTLARDIKVLVRVPFSPMTGKAFTVTAQSSRRTRPYLHNVPNFTGAPQTYTFIRPGLSREQAQQVANQLLKNITLHEVILDANLPGNNSLKKDSVIRVTGTNTSFDQFYYSDVVYRRLNMNGYDMTIQAKNHSVDTQVNI